ncbi:dihydrolipoamide acetyltransferase family protein [Pseudodesulfovibrio piezophilus]|uniref:Dihydrolipoamide acetyltransferase component of pyruvate dehydrogenase complex n=1 Tax=Pseudodesulfovibrio piezophilus (strain DSM 21447 / JCM 15486 / C1TLV30) TaxID=1322246 RepID=M1WNL2_PSEP2|nr:dihydrolipoamide acetyltransferase family protein [Pseudodesulfovibrio piezophilus]CCH50410.1 PdhC [Pseudodesulfovibrio piezophilus C1TLV30]
MAQQVIMPKWGLTMKEGKVVRWLKGEGESVDAGEPLFEVETDKITNSVEAPASGVLSQIIVPEGETAEVQAVLAVIAAPGENPDIIPSGSTATDNVESSGDAVAGEPAVASSQASVEGGDFVPAMPAARKLAKELNVALSTVVGTGPHGTIVMKDVQASADSAFAGINASAKAIEFARKNGIDLGQVSGTGDDGRITKADILRAMNPVSDQQVSSNQPVIAQDTIVPMDGVRKLIGDNMQASLTNAAQLSVFVEIDATEMVSLRAAILERNKRNAEYKLSYNDIVSYAVCRALKRHPIMNSTLQDDGIHLHQSVNLGIAVALPNGLIVPNIKNAGSLTLEELKTEIRDVAGRSRTGGLNMDEISGGTFTISNVSMLGVDGFTPILNPPETGILGVGRIVEKPAVKDGEIQIRQMMTLSLTFNHMTTDGAPAMSFLRELGDMLETPGLMTL